MLRGWAWALREPFTLTVFLGFLVYSVVWSWIALERYYALYASVYDLSLFAQKTWWFLHPGPVDPGVYLQVLVDEPFEFLISPIVLLGYPGILVVQSVALGSGALPLFAIARRSLRSPFAGLCVALAYLTYFPLAGINWFDAHFVAFFVPLFLLGSYFLVRENYRVAGVILLMAGATEYPVILLVVLFAFTLLVQSMYERWLLRSPLPRPPMRFLAVLLFASTAFLVYQFVFLQAYLGPGAFSATAHSGNDGSVIPLDNRVMVFLLVFAPVLFLPFLTPRWIVMLSPMAYLLFGATYQGYAYPLLFHSQYDAIFVPFVFLGLIETFRWMEATSRPAVEQPIPRSLPRRLRLRHQDLPRVPIIALAVLTTNALFALAYQPYGPFNAQTGDSYSFSTATDVNMTLFDQLQQLESLVPRSTPYVLFQNDMVGMLPRPLDYQQTPEVSALGAWTNVTPYDALHGTYPYDLPNGRVTPLRVDYVIDDPYSWGFQEQGLMANNSMIHFIRTSYESGRYGIFGEIGGMLVLERGYNESAKDFVPYRLSTPASALENSTHSGPSGTPIVRFSNGSSPAAWDGPFTVLSPGWYRAQFSLATTNTSPQNHVSLFAMGGFGQTIFGSQYISGSNFTAPNVWSNFDLRFYVDDTYPNVGFPGLNAAWSGTLSIRYIALAQLAPGSPTVS